MSLATETTDFLISISKETVEHARRHGFEDGSGLFEGVLVLRGSSRVAAVEIVDERRAEIRVELRDSNGTLLGSTEMRGDSYLRNYDDPAAAYLDDLDDQLAMVKRLAT